MPIAALALLAALSVCPDATWTIPMSARQISAEELDAAPAEPGQTNRRIGAFLYQGKGIEQTATDPAFADLVIDPQRGLRHRCGNAEPSLSGWNAGTTRGTLKIDPRQALGPVSPGSVEAEQHGASPVLHGYVAGATWPVYSSKAEYFLGLMHPRDRKMQTVIVAFRDEPKPTPARVVARLPMRLDTLTLVPGLHENADYISLEGLTDGKLRQIILRLEPADRDRILAELMAEGPRSDR